MKTEESKFHQQQSQIRSAHREERKRELETICEDARDKAKKDALAQSESKSALSLPEIRLKLDGIFYDYRVVQQRVHGWLNPTDTSNMKDIKMNSYEQEEKEIQSEIEDVDSRLQNDPNIGKAAPDKLSLTKKLAAMISGFLVVSEIGYDSQSFSGLRVWLIVAILIAIGWNISKLFIVRFVNDLTKRAERFHWKALIISGTLLVMTGLFILIAKLRSEILLQAGVSESVGEIAFVAISLVFFVGIWLAHAQTEGIRADLRVNRQKHHDYRLASELQKKKKELTERLRELRNLRLEVEMSGALDQNEAKSLLEMVENHYMSTVNQWLTLYLKGRRTKDEKLPDGIEKIEVKPLSQPTFQVPTNGNHANWSSSRLVSISLLVLTATATLSSCGLIPTEELPVDRRVYLTDRTDEFFIAPSDEPTNVICSTDKLRQSRHVTIRSITSTKSTEVLRMSLSPYRQMGTWDDSWQGHRDTEFREGQIREFEQSVKDKLDSISRMEHSFQNTNLFLPLVRELQELSSFPTDDRQVFVFSDLGENSVQHTWLSGSKEFKELSELNPDIWNSVEGVEKLDLHGIHVFFIYHPDSESEDGFLVRSAYLKHFLELAGAEVSVQSVVRTITY